MRLKKLRVGQADIIYCSILFLNDIILLTLGYISTYYLRFRSILFHRVNPTYILEKNYFFFLIIFLVLSILFLIIFKLYDIKRKYRGLLFYAKIIASILISLIAISCFGFKDGNFVLSRLWLLLIFIICSALIIISRFLINIFITEIIVKKFNIRIEEFESFQSDLAFIRNLTRVKKKIGYGSILVINDIVFFTLSFYLTFYIRFYTHLFSENKSIFSMDTYYFFYSIIFIISALIIFGLFKLYDWDNIYKGSGYYFRIFKAIIINIIVIILVGYFFSAFTFSRIWIVFLFFINIFFLFLSRFLIEYFTKHLLKYFDLFSRVALLGAGENSRRIAVSLLKYTNWGDKIIGYIDTRERAIKHKYIYDDIPILGEIENIKEIVIKNKIQKIIISSPEYKYYEILNILEELKGMDISILICPGFFEFSIKRMQMREISGVPLMQISNVGFFGINLFLKNMLDYVLGTIIFIFFIPIYLIVGLIIKLDSTGPIFYKQKRYTKNFKEFSMYKFRTMYIGADTKLEELKLQNEADGPLFKIKKDPRITKVGKFLRKFSIDELPQIINILKGELSLVGPRPPIPSEVEVYEEWHKKRLNVKQGITGLWQISGRSNLNFEEMVRLDLYYIQNWSIALDFIIILKTIPTVLFGKGAY